MSDKNAIVKNEEYLNALGKFVNCVSINFENMKRDHVKFDKFINSKEAQNVCKKYSDELKRIVNEGGLDYDNFI